MAFHKAWGGSHIRKDEVVSGPFLVKLESLKDEFAVLASEDLLIIDLPKQMAIVESVFRELTSITWANAVKVKVTLGETFASKLAHVINPSVFVMWDNNNAFLFWQEGIRTYFEFLQWTQEQAKAIISDFSSLQLGQGGLFVQET